MSIYHSKVVTIANNTSDYAAGKVCPSHWNEAHVISVDGTTIHTHSNKVDLDSYAPGNFIASTYAANFASTSQLANFMPTSSSTNFATYNHSHTQYQLTSDMSNYASTSHDHHDATITPAIVAFQAPASTPTDIGSTYYDSILRCLCTVTGTATTIQHGQELPVLCKSNYSVQSGTTILNGQPVYVVSGSGKVPKITLASASSENTSYLIGMATENISANTEGMVTVFGNVNDIIIANVTDDVTTTWTEGSSVFLATGTGKLTITKPSAPNHGVFVGTITDRSGNSPTCTIFCHPAMGFELDELHDVSISSKTVGQALVARDLNGTTVWKNDNLDAANVNLDEVAAGTVSTNVQDAIGELNTNASYLGFSTYTAPTVTGTDPYYYVLPEVVVRFGAGGAYADGVEEFTLAASSGTLESQANVVNIICARYVATPQPHAEWVVVTSMSAVDFQEYLPYSRVYRRSGSSFLHTQEFSEHFTCVPERIVQRLVNTSEYARESGMMITTDAVSPATHAYVSSGFVWIGADRIEILDMTTNTAEANCSYYDCIYSGASVGTYSAASTYRQGQKVTYSGTDYVAKIDIDTPEAWNSAHWSTNIEDDWAIIRNSATYCAIDNTHYMDAVSGGLQKSTAGKYTINYIYRGIEGERHLYRVLGTEQFETLEAAQASSKLSDLPQLITSHALLIGRIILAHDEVDPANITIESAFETRFTSTASISQHNNLQALEGGAGGFYYHLGQEDYNAVSQINSTSGASNYFLNQQGSWTTVGGGGGGVGIADSASVVTTGNVSFSNANGISFGLSANGTNSVMTASHNGLTNSGAFVANGYTGYAPQAAAATQTSYFLRADGNWTTIPSQTASLANTSDVILRSSLATGTTSGANGAVATNVAGAATVYFANSTSYAPVSHTHAYVGTGFTSASTTGSQIVGTANSDGVSVGVPLWITTAPSTAGLAATSDVILRSNLATGTTSGANGAVATNVAGAATVYFANSTSYAPVSHTHGYVSTGFTSVSTTGSSIQGTLGTGGLSLGVPLYASITSTNNASSTQNTGSYIAPNGIFVALPGHDGPVLINGSSGNSSYQITGTSGVSLRTGNASGLTFGLADAYTQASVVSQVTGAGTSSASSNFLAANGSYYGVAGGNVTNNYSGGIFGAIQGGASTTASSGTLYFQANNMTLAFSTSTNGSHTLNISEAPHFTGWNLGGNSSGVSSFSISADTRPTIVATNGLYVSGDTNGALTYGMSPITMFEHPIRLDAASTAYSHISVASGIVKYMSIGTPIQFSVIEVPMTINHASTNSSASWSFAHTAVIYTRGAGAASTGLVPIIGQNSAWVASWGTGASTSVINGVRLLSMTVNATTLTPGDYWMAFQQATAQTTVTTYSAGYIQQNMLSANVAAWSVGTANTTNNLFLGQGVYNAAINATSSVLAISSVSHVAASMQRANVIVRLRN